MKSVWVVRTATRGDNLLPSNLSCHMYMGTITPLNTNHLGKRYSHNSVQTPGYGFGCSQAYLPLATKYATGPNITTVAHASKSPSKFLISWERDSARGIQMVDHEHGFHTTDLKICYTGTNRPVDT